MGARPGEPADVRREVEALVREGRHVEAAERCLGAGDLLRASELFAAGWQWARAAEAAAHAGRYDLAHGYAAEAGDEALVGRIREALRARPDQAREAARRAQARGRSRQAGVAWEAAGEPERAAAQYERARAWGEAARCREVMGEPERAARLYERLVREAPWDGEAALRLGRLLAQLGRHEAAVRSLQVAVGDPRWRAGALRLLVACFDALGFRDAAADCLDRLRAGDPAVPLTVPDLLEESFGDRRGLAPPSGDGEPEHIAGRYRVVRSLGAGGSGRVLLCLDVFEDREVAVKLLAVGGGTGGRDACARFAREARIATGVDHPHVVRALAYHARGPLLVMEHVAGGSLEERDKPMAPARAGAVARQVLEALEAVHARGVVHRDIKAANVFFDAHGTVKVGDFGAAHLLDLGTTLTGGMLGTVAAMAPEQVTGASKPTAATDLYAVGVLLFEMLTGRLPYEGPDILAQHLDAPVPRASEAAPWLGPAYDALLASLLAKDPDARPQSAREVLEVMATLPWPGGDAVSPAAPEPPVAPDHTPGGATERYVIGDEGTETRDTFLDRPVRIVACAPEDVPHWRRWAAAPHPFVQAIYDIDEDAGHVVLEAPPGVPLTEATEIDTGRARVELTAALRHLHAAGLPHGRVDADHVWTAPGRTFLVIPTVEPTDERPALEEELAQLEALLDR